MRSIAEDASELLLELGISIDRTVIVGHSMGGIVACEMAAVEAPAGMVILGPVCPSRDTHDAFTRRIEVVKKGVPPNSFTFRTCKADSPKVVWKG